MLCAGDEMGRTQKGNNNAYCQDNEISWVDWNPDDRQKALIDFTARMSRLRHAEGVLHEDWFFQGDRISDSRFKDLTFFAVDGREMSDEDWHNEGLLSFGYLLGGDALVVPDRAGHRPVGDTLLMLLNGNHEEVTFTLPKVGTVRAWDLVLSTANPQASASRLTSDERLPIPGRALAILRLRSPIAPKLETI
jgi:glycogen operon protein